MISYTLYLMEVSDKGQFLHAKVSLSHLVPPVVEKTSEGAAELVAMALYGLAPPEGKMPRCDLSQLKLVPPVDEVGVVP